MRLARSTDIDQVVGTLDDVVRALQGLGRRPLRQDYLCWVEDSETALRGVFLEPDVVAHLHAARFWRLYDGDFDIDQADITRPIPDPCEQEAAAQLAYLTALADQVIQLRAVAASPGLILVYDTNSLMHFQPPDAISWNAVAKVTAARLIVPLVVIDELDAKKYAGSEKMAKRAAGALRALDQILDGAQPGAPVALPDRAGVSVEVLLDEDGHTRAASADDEIIDRAVLLGQLAGKPVTLVTADTGMRLRAQAAGLATLRLPDRYSKDQ
jgi:hypothetical protein